MKSLIGTQRPATDTDGDALFNYHGVTAKSGKFALIQKYHDMLRESGLTPYCPVWHYGYKDGWTTQVDSTETVWLTHAGFWDGKKFAMPAMIEGELYRWSGRPYMCQHVGDAVLDSDTRFRFRGSNGAVRNLASPDFEKEAGAFYTGMQDYLLGLGVTPYIMFDEPSLSYGKDSKRNAIPDALQYGRDDTYYYASNEAVQTAQCLRMLQIARVVRQYAPKIRIGVACVTGQIWKFYEQLHVMAGGTKPLMNWYVLIDDKRKYDSDLQYLDEDVAWMKANDVEPWIYYVDTPWMDGDKTDIDRSTQRALIKGIDGFLFWTGITLDVKRESLIESEPKGKPNVALNERGLWLAEFAAMTPQPESPEQERPMIQTAIGLTTDRKGVAVYGKIQDWLWKNGFSPYLPQMRHATSYNIGLAYDPAAKGLAKSASNGAYGWTPEMIAEVKRFEGMGQMVFAYGAYYYLSKPGALEWLCEDGVRRNQDKLPRATLVTYLRNTLQWFIKVGIKNPYFFVDEPPHHADDDGDGSTYGWTQEVEARIVKFIECAQEAGWPVYVATPNPSSLAFWLGRGTFPNGKPRITPDVWILNADPANKEHYPIDVINGARSGNGAKVWLYNADNYVDGENRTVGMAKYMQYMGATGYLDWSATDTTKQRPRVPMLSVVGDGYVVNETATMLLAELKRFKSLPKLPVIESVPQEEPAMKNRIYQAFMTNLVSDFMPTGLATVSDWATWCEIQIEFTKTHRTAAGERFAPEGFTPFRWLVNNGHEPFVYVNPVAPALAGYMNDDDAFVVGLRETDAFWWRKEQVNQIQRKDWWLKDVSGRYVIGSRKRRIADIANPEYLEWLVNEIVNQDVLYVRFDDANVHMAAFWGGHRMPADYDRESLAGLQSLVRTLRDNEVDVLLNGGWEPEDPDLPTDKWTYPLMENSFGCMIELVHKPNEGHAVNTGFTKFNGGWKTFDESNLPVVIRHWRKANKAVVLAVAYRGGDYPGGYEAFAKKWYTFAADNDALIFVGRDDIGKAGHRVWPFNIPDKAPPHIYYPLSAEPDEEPADIEKEIESIRHSLDMARDAIGVAVVRLASIQSKSKSERLRKE